MALGNALRAGSCAQAQAALIEQTDALLLRAEPELLLHAADLCADTDGRLATALAWRVGMGLHFNGRFAEALEIYRRAHNDGADPAAPADLAELHAALASSLWGRADAEECVAEAEAARRYAEAADDPRAWASVCIAEALVAAHAGDRSACRTAYEKALGYAEAAQSRVVLIRILTNIASLENEEGQYPAALDWLNRALDLWGADDGPMRCVTAFNRAEALVALGRLEEAIADLRASQASARSVGSPLLAMALHGLGEAYRLRGDAARAAVAYREAVATAERTQQAQVIGDALAGLARTTAMEDLDGALAFARRGLEVPTALGRVAPQLATGWLELLRGDRAKALEAAALAIAEAGRRTDPTGLAEALELRALATDPVPLDPIHEAARLWRETGHLIGIADNELITATIVGDRDRERIALAQLERLGVKDDASRIAGGRHFALGRTAAQVSIRTLGPFAVLIGQRPVPVAAWGSRKPREALKYLAARGGRPVGRAELIEVLWPDQHGTGSRLSVILSTLRSVLDPEKTHDPDHFVYADRSTVRLNLDAVELDSVAFERAARRSLDHPERGDAGEIEALQAAIARYDGPFLDDDRDALWAVEPRAHLAVLAREVRRRLALRLGESEPERSIPWLAATLSDDPYDESCHLTLIRSMLRLRRFGEAQRAHETYAAAMAELRVPATPLVDLVD